MRKFFLYHILIFLLVACTKSTTEKPVWVNESRMLTMPIDTLVFNTSGKNWKACIQTLVQPIPLQVHYTTHGFILTQPSRYGSVEGHAQLILCNGTEYFYYELNTLNKEFSSIQNRDYRSPKTLNLDSSLVQQRILHSIDKWRNLIYLPNKTEYFFEDENQQTTKAGTYRIKKEEPLGAYYIHPGHCTNISLSFAFNPAENNYKVVAGPLYDKYNNTIANGTLVAFIYSDNTRTFRIETALLNGVAIAFIPHLESTMKLYAEVNTTQSNTITLTH